MQGRTLGGYPRVLVQRTTQNLGSDPWQCKTTPDHFLPIKGTYVLLPKQIIGEY